MRFLGYSADSALIVLLRALLPQEEPCVIPDHNLAIDSIGEICWSFRADLDGVATRTPIMLIEVKKQRK